MTSFKLIFKNMQKNLRDYLIYFLTLMLAVSLVYAFNSISDQPAFSEMSLTRAVLYDQLDNLLSALSVVISVVLAFLIIYANQFILKRRKKELGIYTVLGMKKGRIARIFAGETLCIGIISLFIGLLFGIILSQGISLIALKLFAVELAQFQFVFSMKALKQTIICFAVIFFIVMIFNVWSVSKVQLIELLTASRKNEIIKKNNRVLPILVFLLSLLCISIAGFLFYKHGILPTRENKFFEIAGIALVVGTLFLFYSMSVVFIEVARSNSKFYLKGLNAFLIQQVSSKIHTNYFIMAIVCGLLTVTICAVAIGTSTAITMNELAKVSTPYDLNVISDVDEDGDSNIVDYLESCNVYMKDYAQNMEQISLYEADLTYGDLFEGQNVKLWRFDENITNIGINVITLSDFNRALAMQGKEAVVLEEGQFLMNCNYKGTYQYVLTALQTHPKLTIGGVSLQRASEVLLQETYFMTQIGNNDRGTIIVPDSVTEHLTKDVNILLVQYKEETNSDEVIQKMIPIGLDESHGYRYTERNMMYDMFYGYSSLVVFLCCYGGLVFLLICATLLALKQLTETTDNIKRYGLLQKLGAKREQINRTLLAQTAVFFAVPLIVAGVYSILFINKGIELVEGFMNLAISTNVSFTVVLFLVIYGGYFLATYLSCKRMVTEQREIRM